MSQKVIQYTSLEGWTRGPASDKSLPEPTEDQIEQWKGQQYDMANSISLNNNFNWSIDPDSPNPLSLVGGLDISFSKRNDVDACVCLVVCRYPSLRIALRAFKMVKLNVAYVPGFLGFREVEAYVSLIKEVQEKYPNLVPQVLMVDGNGLLHYRKAGSASHLGCRINIPTIGVAKKMLVFDGMPTEEGVQNRLEDRDYIELVGRSGYKYGRAMKANSNVIYVSPGNNIDYDTSNQLVTRCIATLTNHDLPEPVFHADSLGRRYLYQNRF